MADETPTPDTVMYHYPFSNVSEGSGHLCVGANTMPTYKKLHKAVNLFYEGAGGVYDRQSFFFGYFIDFAADTVGSDNYGSGRKIF